MDNQQHRNLIESVHRVVEGSAGLARLGRKVRAIKRRGVPVPNRDSLEAQIHSKRASRMKRWRTRSANNPILAGDGVVQKARDLGFDKKVKEKDISYGSYGNHPHPRGVRSLDKGHRGDLKKFDKDH